ncbi:hypothetical protein BGX34_001356, partial [Mortierella sp. NVP85]
MATAPDIQPLQAFRCRSTDRVAHVPTFVDPKSGSRIVLWSDIEAGFENVKSIWKGTSLVPFLKDENFEQVLPLRIAYHPDDELELDTTGTGQDHHSREPSIPSSSTTETFPLRQGPMHHHDKHFFQPSASTTEFSTGARIVDALAIAEASSINSSLSGYSTDTIQNTQPIVLAQNLSLNHSPQDSILKEAAIVQYLNQRFDRLQVETDRNRDLQEQLIQMQQQLGMNQEEMLRMQQKALDRLAIIQSSVQALITQTYELHEYPIPRLFIVLPKTLGLSGKIKSIFSDQFRLYFLCECGTHTMSEDSKTPHHIHLAKHDGYDLEKPSAFFERFGSYVLTVMNMIKYGITAAGLVVPSLASSGIVNGIDTAQKHMDFIKKNIAPLVDDTIKFLDGIKRDN